MPLNPQDDAENTRSNIFGLAHGFRLQKGGIVGRLCYVAIALIVVCPIVIWSIPEHQRIWLLAGVASFVLVIVYMIYRYGCKHPEIAILEGAEIIRREEILIAAKGRRSIKLEDVEVVSNPFPDQARLFKKSDSSDEDET